MPNPDLSMFDPYSSGDVKSSTPSQHNPSSSPSTSITSSLCQHQLEFFINQGYTTGLLNTLLKLKKSYFQRCWIIDNGSNMLVKDSHVLVINNNKNGGIDKLDGISRWDELLDCLGNQAWISSNLNVSMRFALLNQIAPNIPQYFTMGEHTDQNLAGKSPEQEISRVGQILKSIQPNGPTTLTRQLSVLQRYISSISSQLQCANKKISVHSCLCVLFMSSYWK